MTSAPQRRSAARLGLALAIAATGLAGSASGALAAPSLRVAPSSSIDPAGETLTITGRGFLAPDVASGIYVAQTATVDGTIVAGAAKWLRAAGPTPDTRLEADGTFTTTIDVTKTLDGGRYDCSVVQCAITSWPEHSNPRAGELYASRVILFRSAGALTPAVTVEPRINLPRDASSVVTISGTGFDPSTAGGNGFYIGYGPRVERYWTDTSAYGVTKWIRPGGAVSDSQDVLNPDGSFSTTLTLAPSYTARGGNFDCRLLDCQIITFAAQGSSDRGFDTATAVKFVPLPHVVTVSPSTGLNRDAATTVTVQGREFLNGTYVAQSAVVDGRLLTAPQSGTRWIRSAGGPTPADQLNPDGTFTTTLSVAPTFTSGTTTVDCRVTACAVSTWRQHSNPTVASLYTSTPIAFAPAPVPPAKPGPPVVPPVKPAPPVLGIRTAAKPVGLNRKRIAALATFTSNVDARVSVPRTVKFKLGRKRYTVKVLAPKTIKAGKKAKLRVQLTRKAVKAVKARRGRNARVSVNITLVANGKKVVKTASAKLKGGR